MSGDKMPRSVRTGWRGMLAAVPAVGIALLPNVTCPACWPAYAGLLSALGVPVLIGSAVMMPLTVVFMAMAVGSMAYRAKNRRGYGPFLIGLVAAATLIIGKFVFAIESLTYGGLFLLLVATLWNSWPKRRQAEASCAACAGPTELVQLRIKNGS